MRILIRYLVAKSMSCFMAYLWMAAYVGYKA